MDSRYMSSAGSSTPNLTQSDAIFFAKVVVDSIRQHYVGSKDKAYLNQALGLMHALFMMTIEEEQLDTESIIDYCQINPNRLTNLYKELHALGLLDREQRTNVLGIGHKLYYFFHSDLLEKIHDLKIKTVLKP
jgi:hypothetical protein